MANSIFNIKFSYVQEEKGTESTHNLKIITREIKKKNRSKQELIFLIVCVPSVFFAFVYMRKFNSRNRIMSLTYYKTIPLIYYKTPKVIAQKLKNNNHNIKNHIN